MPIRPLPVRRLIALAAAATTLTLSTASAQTVLWSNPAVGQPYAAPQPTGRPTRIVQPARVYQPGYGPLRPQYAPQAPAGGVPQMAAGATTIYDGGLPDEFSLPPAVAAPTLPVPGDAPDAVPVERLAPQPYAPQSYAPQPYGAQPYVVPRVPTGSAAGATAQPSPVRPSPSYAAPTPVAPQSSTASSAAARPGTRGIRRSVERPTWQIPSAAKVWMSAHRFR